MKHNIVFLILSVFLMPNCSSNSTIEYDDDSYSVFKMNNKTLETIFNDEIGSFNEIKASSRIKISGVNKDDSVMAFSLFASPELYDYEEDNALNLSYKDGYFVNNNDFKGIDSGRYYYCLVFTNGINKRYIGFATGQDIAKKEDYSAIIDFNNVQSIIFKGVDQPSSSNNYEGKIVNKIIDDSVAISDFVSAFDKSVILNTEYDNRHAAPGVSSYSLTINYAGKDSNSFGITDEHLLFLSNNKTFEFINPLVFQIIRSWMV